MKSLINNIMGIRREDRGISLLMFAYFFLVITSFWILKPLKKGLFIQYYKDMDGLNLWGWQMTGSQAEQLAKVLNMVVALVAVLVFTWLARHFRRQALTYIFSGFFLAAFEWFSVVIDTPNAWQVWFFYLFGDLYSTVMVATFFAFLNDSFTSENAKRNYGPIVLGGVMGGAFGSMFVRVWIEDLANSDWLRVLFGIGVFIVILAFIAGHLVEKRPRFKVPEAVDTDASNVDRKTLLEGAGLVFRSRYLISIALIVGIYEICSTVMDFQFTATIEHFLEGDEIGRQFSTIYTITNFTALFVQLFLTGFVLSKLGQHIALLILPCAMVMGSVAFLVMPVLWVGSFLNTVDNGLSYSLNQSSKELLYVPTSRDEKYKAKAFIDVFILRFSKALAVFVTLTITALFTAQNAAGDTELVFERLRWLSLFSVGLIVVWVYAARYAARIFDKIAAEESREGSAPVA